MSWARDSCGECLGTAGEAASSAREASGVSGRGPGVGAGTALSRHGGRTGGWVPTGREWQVRGQGFGRGSAGAFALSLKEEEDRGRGGRQDGGGQASARAVSPHRALRGSGQAAGRTERATPQAPLPVLPSPGGRFLDPSAGLAGAQPAIAQRPGSADLRRRQWAEAASWGAVPRMEGPPSGRGHTRRVTDELSLGLMTSSGRGRAPPLP